MRVYMYLTLTISVPYHVLTVLNLVGTGTYGCIHSRADDVMIRLSRFMMTQLAQTTTAERSDM
eukprot:SAG31_NODE_326_length_17664_cov_10.038543_14_plen_63_part_00